MTNSPDYDKYRRQVRKTRTWQMLFGMALAGILFATVFAVLNINQNNSGQQRIWAEFALEEIVCQSQLGEGQQHAGSDVENWTLQGGIYAGTLVCMTSDGVTKYDVAFNALTGEYMLERLQ